MAESGSPAPGLRDAATLLLAIGEEPAAQVLKQLGAKEVQKLGTTMTAIGALSRDDVAQTLQKFIDQVEAQSSIGADSEEYLRSVLTNALGADKASGLLDRMLLGHVSKGLETLKWMDARNIAEQLRNEHPQTIAVVLSYLEPDHAAGVLMRLSESTRADIVARIATLDGVQPTALSELDDVIERQFSGNTAARTATLGGAKAAAGILNSLEHSVESALLEQIRSEDETLATRIAELMFTFEDLLELEDRAMQEVLRTVSSDVLVPALKAADAALLAKFMKNMSQRAGEMLKDDIETSGPIKVSDVDVAQKKILAAARKLADEGKISLGGVGEDYVYHRLARGRRGGFMPKRLKSWVVKHLAMMRRIALQALHDLGRQMIQEVDDCDRDVPLLPIGAFCAPIAHWNAAARGGLAPAVASDPVGGQAHA